MHQAMRDQLLRTYQKLNDLRLREITSLPDFHERMTARGSSGFHTDFDTALDLIEDEVQRSGYFFWPYYEDWDDGEEYPKFALEEVGEIGKFNRVQAVVRYNAIYMLRDKEFASHIDEMQEIDHEAHRHGYEMVWDNDGDREHRYTCLPLREHAVYSGKSGR